MDLSIPQYGIRQYDWIISLEVAEHIPEKYEAVQYFSYIVAVSFAGR
jgi:2-polyprenyl-3-methyl-5-hydroxy-6-metoxy-1,4-benzoquinol methylase